MDQVTFPLYPPSTYPINPPSTPSLNPPSPLSLLARPPMQQDDVIVTIEHCSDCERHELLCHHDEASTIPPIINTSPTTNTSSHPHNLIALLTHIPLKLTNSYTTTSPT